MYKIKDRFATPILAVVGVLLVSSCQTTAHSSHPALSLSSVGEAPRGLHSKHILTYFMTSPMLQRLSVLAEEETLNYDEEVVEDSDLSN